MKIPKREYNPELSFFSNVSLDLIDFKDRVYPLAKDAARLDGAFQHQRMSAEETMDNIKSNRESFNKFLESSGSKPINFEQDKGLLSSDEFLSGEESSRNHSTIQDHITHKTKGEEMNHTQEQIIHGRGAGQEKNVESQSESEEAFSSDEDSSDSTTSDEERHRDTETVDDSKKN